MTNDEAKFMLTAYRPSGQDAADPAFAGAIDQARTDPALKQWFAREQAFDAAIAGRLREVAPPAGLREAILTGAKLSRPKQKRREVFTWMALAAAIVLLLGVVAVRSSRSHGAAGLSAFAQFALADAHHAGHIGDPDQPLDRWLASTTAPLEQTAVPITETELKRTGCRELDFAGRKVFEVCFTRGGVDYHLYLLPRANAADSRAEEQVELSDQSGAAAAWSDARFVYALATQAGPAVLRRVL